MSISQLAQTSQHINMSAPVFFLSETVIANYALP